MGVLSAPLEVRGEMPQELRCLDDAHAADGVTSIPHVLNSLEHVVHVALRVHAPRNREPHEVGTRRVLLAAVRVHAEHHGADFAAANAGLDIEFHGEGLAGVVQRLDVRQEAPRIEIDGVAARRRHDRDSGVEQAIDDVTRGQEPVVEVVLVEDFAQADGDGFEIAAGEAAVGRKALGEDQDIAFTLGELGVVGAQEATNVGKGILLGGHRAAVRQGEHLAGNVDDSRCPRSPAHAT